MEVSCNHGNIVNMPSWWLMTSNGNLFETGPAWASQVLHLLQFSFLSLYSYPSLKQLAICKGAHVCNSPSSIPPLLSFPPQCLLILVYLNCWPVKSPVSFELRHFWKVNFPNSPGWVNILAFLHHVLSSWHANFCLVEAVVTIEIIPSKSWAGLATIARQLDYVTSVPCCFWVAQFYVVGNWYHVKSRENSSQENSFCLHFEVLATDNSGLCSFL